MSEENTHKNIAETIREIMELSADRSIQIVNGVPVRVTEHGEDILTDLMTAPFRPSYAITARKFEDFLDVLTSESEGIAQNFTGRGYADLSENPALTYVFDHDNAAAGDGPLSGWQGDIRATFQPIRSRQLDVWARSDTAWLSQADFAEFIEVNIDDVAGDSSKLLSMARNLEATVKSTFKGDIRPESGDVTIHWETETNTGDIKVPQEFQIGIPIFKHADAFRLNCALRYRVRDGNLAFQYRIKNLDKAVETLFEEWLHAIVEAGWNFIRGTHTSR